MKRIIVFGANGRMGRRICALAASDPRVEIVGALGREEAGAGRAATLGAADAVIDFSSPDGVSRSIEIARDKAVALLVGTTGLSPENHRVLGEAARSVPVMVAPNTALGVAVLNHLAVVAARLLGPDFDVDLVESHHAAKRDAPSGTALRIAAALREQAAVELDPGRVHAIRAGDIVGEHAIRFAGPGERLEISHSATSRDLFARGALRAAAWLSDQPAGRYTIEQALGLADD